MIVLGIAGLPDAEARANRGEGQGNDGNVFRAGQTDPATRGYCQTQKYMSQPRRGSLRSGAGPPQTNKEASVAKNVNCKSLRIIYSSALACLAPLDRCKRSIFVTQSAENKITSRLIIKKYFASVIIAFRRISLCLVYNLVRNKMRNIKRNNTIKRVIKRTACTDLINMNKCGKGICTH